MFTLFTPTTELKRFKKGTLPKAALAVIILLPLLYSALYLWAFWDPFNKTNNIPVAVVNNDVGVLVDGKKLDAGKQVVANLKNNNQLDWKFTNAKEAAQGVSDGKYYFSVTLDPDFSKAIASPLSANPHKATLKIDFDNKNNYIAGVMGKSAIQQLQQVIASTINTQTLDKVVVAITSAGGGLKAAADGATQLEAGTSKLATGGTTLANGLTDASKGARELTNGLQEAKNGTSQLAKGVNKFEGGLNRVGGGAQELSNKLDQIHALLTGILTSQTQLKNDIQTTTQRINELHNPVLSSMLTPLLGSLSELNTNINQLPAPAQVEKLFTGTDQLAYQLHNKQSELLKGLTALVQGVNQLDKGMTKLHTGGQTLSDGLVKLSAGGSDLNQGIDQLHTGASTLAFKLSEGVSQIPNIPADKTNLIANTLGNPLESSLNYHNEATTFGYGFSPFFIPLALFVGGIITWLMIKPLLNTTLITRMSAWKATLTSFAPGFIIQLLQATVIFLVIRFGLKLYPAHSWGAWGTMLLIATCFAAMIQMFNVVFGSSVGRVLSMSVLMLQIIASGGIYPVETQPKLLSYMHKIDPMTYAVNALRATIMGGWDNSNLKDIFALALVTISCLVISSWGANRNKVWNMERLYPPIKA